LGLFQFNCKNERLHTSDVLSRCRLNQPTREGQEQM
jgi:hypothetical protein